jgi:hypothetical protein
VAFGAVSWLLSLLLVELDESLNIQTVKGVQFFEQKNLKPATIEFIFYINKTKTIYTMSPSLLYCAFKQKYEFISLIKI